MYRYVHLQQLMYSVAIVQMHVPMLTGKLPQLKDKGDTPLHLAAWGGHTTCVECLLSAPGIDVTITKWVSWSNEY